MFAFNIYMINCLGLDTFMNLSVRCNFYPKTNEVLSYPTLWVQLYSNFMALLIDLGHSFLYSGLTTSKFGF